ncbi:hypothetical protein [Lactococcus lactis]|uniref:hypothetical protein n=1 Tax=Lactococcus lactis TaxID=1358 RepID=UPI0019149675|nr:hypothetical protein [Lactococcus lactis]WDA68714.1 hypothetical protein IL310_14515 [Lactococcus lactis]
MKSKMQLRREELGLELYGCGSLSEKSSKIMSYRGHECFDNFLIDVEMNGKPFSSLSQNKQQAIAKALKCSIKDLK